MRETYRFQESAHTHRKIINLGYDYFKMADGDRTFEPIPSVFHALLQKALDQLKSIAVIEIDEATQYLNCIISDCWPADHLEPHIDVDMTKQRTLGKDVDFFFGDEVIGIVLECDEIGAFFIQESLDGGVPWPLSPTGKRFKKPMAQLLSSKAKPAAFRFITG